MILNKLFASGTVQQIHDIPRKIKSLNTVGMVRIVWTVQMLTCIAFLALLTTDSSLQTLTLKSNSPATIIPFIIQLSICFLGLIGSLDFGKNDKIWRRVVSVCTFLTCLISFVSAVYLLVLDNEVYLNCRSVVCSYTTVKASFIVLWALSLFSIHVSVSHILTLLPNANDKNVQNETTRVPEKTTEMKSPLEMEDEMAQDPMEEEDTNKRP
ncbi:hypothetical protein BKA69DRAFT_585810 [Paraphysoderma sedebokerense]|nr:hypothetical protein BKA69DRAFT_585810 [Paraphysoderma sedebokerense]